MNGRTRQMIEVSDGVRGHAPKCAKRQGKFGFHFQLWPAKTLISSILHAQCITRAWAYSICIRKVRAEAAVHPTLCQLVTELRGSKNWTLIGAQTWCHTTIWIVVVALLNAKVHSGHAYFGDIRSSGIGYWKPNTNKGIFNVAVVCGRR